MSDVTIQFETGPNLRELDVAALCTRRGEGCAGTPLGDGAVDVSLPKTVAKQTVEVEVTNIDVTETDDVLIDCYIRGAGAGGEGVPGADLGEECGVDSVV